MIAFLHGFTGAPSMWEPIAAEPHIAIPLAGHGVPADRIDGFWDEVDRVSDVIGASTRATPIHLVGYSLGARLALGVAVRHPVLCRRLTLIGVHPGLRSESERDHRAQADARWCELLEREGIERFVNAWEALPMWESQRGLPHACLARQRQIRLGHEPTQLAASLRATGLSAMPDLWPRLPDLNIPVHLVAGQLDDKFRALADRAAEHIAGATVSTVPGAGHNPILELPDAVGRLVLQN